VTLGFLLSGFDSVGGKKTGVSIDSSCLRAPAGRKRSRVLDSSLCVCKFIFSVCSYFVPAFFSLLYQGTSGKDGYGLLVVNGMKDVMVFSRYFRKSQPG